MTAEEFNSWIYQSDGQELWDELGSDFKLKHFLVGNTGSTLFGWFKKEIDSVSDLSKIKNKKPRFWWRSIKNYGRDSN
jgi:TRAP-type mannitol/chloroaromatic compound transport system substrate-binding protein